jgi:plastocyanin
MSSATTKLLTISITAIMIAAAITIVTAFMSLNIQVQKAGAQMMAQSPSTSRMGPSMMGLVMMAAAPNVTSSVPMFPIIANVISSQIHTSLVNATMTAEKIVGKNAHAISAQIGVENGFLVYTIWVIDSGNNLHKIIIDPVNGKVLSSQQWPMRSAMMNPGMMGMMGPMMGGSMRMNPGMMGMMGPMMMRNQNPQNSSTTQTSGNTAGSGSQVSIVEGASTMADEAFSPNPINVKVGGTVTWTNDDSQPHTVTSGTGSSDPNMGKEFDSSPGLSTLLAPTQMFSHKFTTAGEFPYFCQIHPTMVGKVIVT